MANVASIEVVDSKTIKVHLPDGMSVTPGKPVPPELLEIVALQLRVAGSLGDEADCMVQFN